MTNFTSLEYFMSWFTYLSLLNYRQFYFTIILIELAITRYYVKTNNYFRILKQGFQLNFPEFANYGLFVDTNLFI